ncbi:unnamed protein product, partial [Ectocarpus sp. 12 AP-2014]
PTCVCVCFFLRYQDDVTGDGTTTSVLFTGELLRQAERYLTEGLHPRVLTEGFELAKEHALELLDAFRSTRQGGHFLSAVEEDRELLESVARTSLRTKLREEVADNVSGI